MRCKIKGVAARLKRQKKNRCRSVHRGGQLFCDHGHRRALRAMARHPAAWPEFLLYGEQISPGLARRTDPTRGVLRLGSLILFDPLADDFKNPLTGVFEIIEHTREAVQTAIIGIRNSCLFVVVGKPHQQH